MSHKILLVEDDLIDQMAFKNFVKKEGLEYDYKIANSVSEASSISSQDSFDLVILDYKLGDGTAFDLFQTFKDTPSIILTGAGDEEVAVTALKNGAYDYIVKDQERRYLKILPLTVTNVLDKHQNEIQLKQNKEYLRLFVRHTPAAVAMLDKDLKYIMYSRRWLEDYNLGNQEIIGKSHLEVFPEIGDEWKQIYRRCLNGATEKREEDRFIRKDGSFHYIKWEIVPWYLETDEVGGIIMFTEEITEKVLARERIEAQKEELARSNADLEQFAYVASHDLQEPLRMVGNFVQLLEVRFKDKVDEKGQNYINYAVEGVSRMQRLINDLLEYSRVGRKDEKFHCINPKSIVNEAVNDLQQPIQERGVKINIENLPEEVNCIESQLRLVLRNLIGNGIKFNKNDHPEITISGEEDEEYWYISVKDNGIGIDERYKDQIFAIFQRLHNNSEYPGTGIGLAICKKVVERHGGKIRQETLKNNGSVFRFSLHKQLNLKQANPPSLS